MGKLLQMDLLRMLWHKEVYAIILLIAFLLDLILNDGGFLLVSTVVAGAMAAFMEVSDIVPMMNMMLPVRNETVVAEKYIFSVGVSLIWGLIVYGIYIIGMQLTGNMINQMAKLEMVMLLNMLPWISIIGIPLKLKNVVIDRKVLDIIEITAIALYVANRIWSVRNLNVSNVDTSLNLHAVVAGSAGGLLLAVVGLAVSYQISIRIIQKEDL